MTNYEKIKAMSVEEMADFICGIYNSERDKWICGDVVFSYNDEKICKWLESKVEENMLPEICSCGYRFENDETICPNCEKKVEEDG